MTQPTGAIATYIKSREVKIAPNDGPFRMPVSAHEAGGFSGEIAGGRISVGDHVKMLPSVKESAVAKIVVEGSDVNAAETGQSVTLSLADEIGFAAGDVLCAASNPCELADQFRTTIIWTSADEMLPGRTYLIEMNGGSAQATIAQPRHALDPETLDERAARTLAKDEIGVCNINLDRNVAFDPYDDNNLTGAFVLRDRLTKDVVATGMIDFALRRAANIHMQALDIDKGARSEIKGQRPAILWFTGLSGSGKSTIANALEKKLHASGRHTAILDGDNVRHGLNQDLGFTDADRVENIRRVSEVGKLMVEAGLIVLVSFISPFRSERKMARQMMEDGEFVEIHVDTPLEVAEQRDVKGLYAKARSGEIKNFTGIDSPYEAPLSPEIRLATTNQSPEAAADELLTFLKANGYIGG